MTRYNRRTLGIAAMLAALGLAGVAGAAPASAQAQAEVQADAELFARVNGKPISRREFTTAYSNHVRQQFYHREVSEDRLAAARKEVGDRLIDRILLLEEAERRGVAPDETKLTESISGYERRYAGSAMWQQNREALLPGLRTQLAEQNRLEQLERRVREIPDPSPDEARAFFEANPDLFTEPEKLHIQTILLKVDPSSPRAAWDAAREEAARMVARLRGGADFAETARLHSNDRSAANGGDMGYLHLGMLPEALQSRIDQLQTGIVGDPIDVLEGIGIFRIDERIPARKREFADVMGRARDLLKREKAESAWKEFLAGLRQTASITVFDAASR
ncbi:MAG TPA: peptidyl-prolyl cis-trans isomerase [Rhodocyclaceae bacterium]|nr:peptidyl-prolyl cis-trans isomerase [Rhodocyclaceae bacterium]